MSGKGEALLTQDRLKQLLWYNPCSGNFRSCRTYKVVGTLRKDGYIKISVNNRSYLAHRLAWLYVNGEWPTGQIDHINHDRSDNRISNLRDVDNRENHKNETLSSNNTSGVIGVYWKKSTGKWWAGIKVDGRMIHLGYYEYKTDAISARLGAERLYKFHSNHGK